MEKNNNMQQNQIADDELEQVGGGKLFDVFTMEFRELFGRSDDQDDSMFSEEDDSTFGIRTLEMRVDPKKKAKRNKNDVMKL